MSAIFISHSSADNQQVAGLAQRLEQQDHHSIFLDFDPEQGIVAGKSWERTLYRKLRACRAVILWCTDDYLKSHWCFAEIALARMEGKPIFALLTSELSPAAKLPSILAERQYIDLRSHPEEGFKRLWRGLADLDLTGMVWNPKNPPYRGLNYYREQDAPVFFGRETETRSGLELVNRGAPNLMMVLGASGSGKSSLVRAGMLPRLRRDPQWLVVDPFRPRKDPFAELADALADAHRLHAPEQAQRTGDPKFLLEEMNRWRIGLGAAPASRGAEHASVHRDERVTRLIDQLEDLNENPPTPRRDRMVNFLDWTLDDLREICGQTRPGESLFGDATPLVEICDRLRRASDREDGRVLIIIDQFEELLGHAEPDHPANRFLSLLRASVEAEECPLMAVGTMRSDFLGAFQRHPSLRGIDFESLSVASMEPSGMRRVIEEPAKLAAIDLEDGLPERLLDDTETPDALPLLSFTLWVLWRDYKEDGILEVAEYEQLGRLDGAVSREADALLESARRVEKEEPLRRAFVHMARLSDEGNYARRPVNWADDQLVPVHDMLEQFVDRRLLVKRGEVVEVAHEALFRSWTPLKTWLDENRADLLLRRQISRDAATWHEDPKKRKDTLWRGGRLQQAEDLLAREGLPERELGFVKAGVAGRRRRQWTFGGLITTALVLFAALGTFGLGKAALATKNEGVANMALAEARQNEELAKKALSEAHRNEGRLWLERASSRAFPGRQIMAAKAIGFQGFGREGLTENTKELHPVLLQPNTAEYGTARELILNPGANLQPPRLVWSSPISRHHDGVSLQLAFNEDSSRLLNLDSTGGVQVWNIESGELVMRDRLLHTVRFDEARATFSPDGGQLWLFAPDGILRSWKIATGERLPNREAPDSPVFNESISVDFSDDSSRLIIHSGGAALVWDIASDQVYTIGKSEPGDAADDDADDVEDTFISSDGRRFVTLIIQGDNNLKLTTGSVADVAANVEIDWPQEIRKGPPQDIRLSPNGKFVATLFRLRSNRSKDRDNDKRSRRAEFAAYTWDLETSELVQHTPISSDDELPSINNKGEFAPRTDPKSLLANASPDLLALVKLATANPDFSMIATSLDKGNIAIWKRNGDKGFELLPYQGIPTAPARDGGFSSDGNQLYWVCSDGVIRIRDLFEGSEQSMQGPRDPLAIAMSKSAQFIAAIGSREAQVWQADEDGQFTKRLQWPLQENVLHIEFAEDDSLLYGMTSSGHFFSLPLSQFPQDGEDPAISVAPPPDGITERVTSCDFHLDENTIVMGTLRGRIHIWDTSDERLVRSIDLTHASKVTSIHLSPSRLYYVTVTEDGEVTHWNLGSDEPIRSLPSGALHPLRAYFSPDESHIVAACRNGMVRWWDAENGEVSFDLQAGAAQTGGLAFSPGGILMGSASEDHSVRLWEFAPPDADYSLATYVGGEENWFALSDGFLQPLSTSDHLWKPRKFPEVTFPGSLRTISETERRQRFLDQSLSVGDWASVLAILRRGDSQEESDLRWIFDRMIEIFDEADILGTDSWRLSRFVDEDKLQDRGSTSLLVANTRQLLDTVDPSEGGLCILALYLAERGFLEVHRDEFRPWLASDIDKLRHAVTSVSDHLQATSEDYTIKERDAFVRKHLLSYDPTLTPWWLGDWMIRMGLGDKTEKGQIQFRMLDRQSFEADIEISSSDDSNLSATFVGKSANEGRTLTGKLSGTGSLNGELELRFLHESQFDGEISHSQGKLSLRGERSKLSFVVWPPDEWSPDYRHCSNDLEPLSREPFKFSGADFELLLAANRFEPASATGAIPFALRGCLLHEGQSVESVKTLSLVEHRPDHRNFRSVLGFYHRKERTFSAYPGSTVPWHVYLLRGVRQNVLPTGCYIYRIGSHIPGSRSRWVYPALRLSDADGSRSGPATVRRTLNDPTYGISDRWDLSNPADNIVCSYSYTSFSSAGTLTVRGGVSYGDWMGFQSWLKEADVNARMDLVLLTGKEARLASEFSKPTEFGEESSLADLSTDPTFQRDLERLRMGSNGSEVRKLQKTLNLNATGYFGPKTVKALADFQKEKLGWADGIYSREMDRLLGLGVYSDEEKSVDPSDDNAGDVPPTPSPEENSDRN